MEVGELLYQRRPYNTTDMFVRKTNLMHIKTLHHGANIIDAWVGNKNDIFFPIYEHEKK